MPFAAITTNGVIGTLLVLLTTCQASVFGQDPGTGANHLAHLTTRIENGRGQPVAGARAEVRLWTGRPARWEKASDTVYSNESGQVVFDALPTDKYLSLVVHGEGFASSMQDFQLSAGENRVSSFKLSRPVRSWVNVSTLDGAPIEGAEIERLDFVDANNSLVVIDQQTAQVLGFSLTSSNTEGRLNLPPIPSEARVTLKIIHRDWAASKSSEVRATPGLLSSVVLCPGAKVELELVASRDVTESLNGQSAFLQLVPPDGGNVGAAALRHRYQVDEGIIEFTAHAGTYHHLALEMEDYFVTPDFRGESPAGPSEITFGGPKPQRLSLLVRPKTVASGRVVDQYGKPVSGITVIGSIENVAPRTSSRPMSDQSPNGRKLDPQKRTTTDTTSCSSPPGEQPRRRIEKGTSRCRRTPVPRLKQMARL